MLWLSWISQSFLKWDHLIHVAWELGWDCYRWHGHRNRQVNTASDSPFWEISRCEGWVEKKSEEVNERHMRKPGERVVSDIKEILRKAYSRTPNTSRKRVWKQFFNLLWKVNCFNKGSFREGRLLRRQKRYLGSYILKEIQ